MTQKKNFDALKESLDLKNIMQTPKVVKIVVSTGVGKVNKDKKRMELVEDRLARITGQAVAPRVAKKAIANFKSRAGDTVGFQVTLRGERAEAFLQKIIHIVFPRVKDFRGLKSSAIDEMGNITIGIKEHTVFPETADEDSKDVFGIAITVVTTAKDKTSAEKFLRHLGVPLQV